MQIKTEAGQLWLGDDGKWDEHFYWGYPESLHVYMNDRYTSIIHMGTYKSWEDLFA